MQKIEFKKKISKLKKSNILIIILLMLIGILMTIIKGMPVKNCPIENYILNYFIISSIIILLPAAYIIYTAMIRKSLKSNELRSRFRTFQIAYYIRLSIITIEGLFISVAYFVYPTQNYLLLLIAVILILLLYLPTDSRTMAELQINDEMFDAEIT